MSGYVLSIDADADLQDIWSYTVDTWGERQADNYIVGLFQLFDRFAGFPDMGRRRPELGKTIRSFPHQSHVVFFMPWQNEIAIVRVLHASRDLAALFEDFDPIARLTGKLGD